MGRPVETDVSPADAMFFFAGGRMYVNYSNMMWLAGPKQLAKNMAPTDALMARILADVDAKRYRAAEKPPWVSSRLVWLIPRMLWSLRRFFWNGLRAVLAPERAYRAYRQTVDALQAELREHLDDDVALDAFRHTYETRMREAFDAMMAVLPVGMVPPHLAVPRKDDEARALADKLKLGTPGNVVVEMGIALYRLAKQLDRSDFDDLDRLADLDAAARDATLDLREIRDKRARFLKELEAHVTTFPPVIDSRGRILRPPSTEAAPGVLTGMPVSPGVVTGPVKVLHTPHEKTVEKGDVLVAYTTDPGWTPLFVNAAAIVLEVGGVLQHGAVVAREYGKPCVVGIERVVARLHDGERVEVDGTTGTIRQLS